MLWETRKRAAPAALAILMHLRLRPRLLHPYQSADKFRAASQVGVALSFARARGGVQNSNPLPRVETLQHGGRPAPFNAHTRAMRWVLASRPFLGLAKQRASRRNNARALAMTRKTFAL